MILPNTPGQRFNGRLFLCAYFQIVAILSHRCLQSLFCCLFSRCVMLFIYSWLDFSLLLSVVVVLLLVCCWWSLGAVGGGGAVVLLVHDFQLWSYFYIVGDVSLLALFSSLVLSLVLYSFVMLSFC